MTTSEKASIAPDHVFFRLAPKHRQIGGLGAQPGERKRYLIAACVLGLIHALVSRFEQTFGGLSFIACYVGREMRDADAHGDMDLSQIGA